MVAILSARAFATPRFESGLCNPSRKSLACSPWAVCRAARKSFSRSSIAAVVRLNIVSPGQLANSIGEVGGAPGQVPIGRDGSFEDVFQAVEYLLKADYVTGANIEVGGGYRL